MKTCIQDDHMSTIVPRSGCLGMPAFVTIVVTATWHTWCVGEEVVTKESLVSFCWRLIPYWLNSWEQQWGAECSSVMFELPHFALELLVVLPCVQVMAMHLALTHLPAVVCHSSA